MTDSEESAPLLSAGVGKSSKHAAQENTPLLSSSSTTPRYDGSTDRGPGGDDAASIRSNTSARPSQPKPPASPRRIPSIVAMVVLAAAIVTIIVLAFFVPAAVEEYAKQAAVVEPTNLSLESITAGGVRARIQANFRLDGTRVPNDGVRRIGRATTWLVRSLSTEATEVKVFLPDYDYSLLGTAQLPPLTFDIVDGHSTAVDFVAELSPGDAEGVRDIVNKWLAGGIDEIRLQGATDITLRSGLIPLGTHRVIESLTFEAEQVPELPAYNITRLNFEEVAVPGSDKRAMAADASITAYNPLPVHLSIPELGFEILVPNCSPNDPFILVAQAVTSQLEILPRADVTLNVHGLIRDIPASLTTLCPNSNSSPLDLILKQYMSGESATIFVRGSGQPTAGTPQWIAEILASITVPVPFPGRTFDKLIRNFSLSDVQFTLPDPDAEEGDPAADPKVSGTIEVFAALPSEMNFDINVTHVQATADVFYMGRKFGELNLHQWQKANSSKIVDGAEPMLKVRSRVVDVPLTVTDEDQFGAVVRALFFGAKQIILDIDAVVAVKVQTVLGPLVLKNVPAQGNIPVKPLPKEAAGSLSPTVGDIRVVDTTSTSVTIHAVVNITNPTMYTARIPYVNIHIVKNGSIIGEAIAEGLDITAGNNTNLPVSATWSPLTIGGEVAAQVGRDLISQYLSGYNTTIDLRMHEGSIPSQPLIGRALSKINITVAAPKLKLPGDDPEEETHFIRDATFHVFSSTATFTLVSPLRYDTLFLDNVNATAFYNGTEPVGVIEYDEPFSAPPGSTVTPKMPVDWSLGGGGYDKVKKALGGTLKLDAFAVVGVRLGNWNDTIWYNGKSIGASIRL